TVDHLVGHGGCEQDDEVRLPDLSLQIAGHPGKYLCFTFIFPAYLPVLTFHPLISAYDDNAHVRSPFCRAVCRASISPLPPGPPRPSHTLQPPPRRGPRWRLRPGRR